MHVVAARMYSKTLIMQLGFGREGGGGRMAIARERSGVGVWLPIVVVTAAAVVLDRVRVDCVRVRIA